MDLEIIHGLRLIWLCIGIKGSAARLLRIRIRGFDRVLGGVEGWLGYGSVDL